MNWGEQAACHTPGVDPELWYAERDPDLHDAIEICTGQCTVRRACGKAAVDRGERFGIRAGFKLDQPGGWEALQDWVGVKRLAAPAESTTTKPVRTVTCSCGRVFTTRWANTQRCNPCRRDLVNASQVQSHIALLQSAAGMTYHQIAARAGMSHSTVKEITRREFVQRDTAQRILQLPVTVAEAVPA